MTWYTLSSALTKTCTSSALVWIQSRLANSVSSLASGDVILSGTPAGVGPVVRGDVMRPTTDGLGALEIPVS
jgi:fumarylpyruvate hydrolase